MPIRLRTNFLYGSEKRMTDQEKRMVYDLQHAEKTSTNLKALALWIEKIEEIASEG